MEQIDKRYITMYYTEMLSYHVTYWRSKVNDPYIKQSDIEMMLEWSADQAVE